MKSLGIVRKIDELGRIVLPKELRMVFDIHPGDPLEIYTDRDGTIILKKYQSRCIFCGSHKNVREYKDNMVCKNCINGLIKVQSQKDSDEDLED